MGKLHFLGTGTSTGVPVIGCECRICVSDNLKDKRLRSSVWINTDDGKSVVIDTSTDFRAQALRERMKRVDAVLFTHHHSDHVHGIDELRSFNFLQGSSIPCYGGEFAVERIRTMFPYIFDGKGQIGGGKPQLSLEVASREINIGDSKFMSIPVLHGDIEVLGYRVNDTAYVTDCSCIPPSSADLLQNLDTLILGALGLKRHDTHFTVEEAIEVIEELKPKQAYLTHLNHTINHDEMSSKLPQNVKLAWDGLVLNI